MAQLHKHATEHTTIAGSISTRGIKYFIFSFISSGHEVKQCCITRIRRKVGNGSVLMGTGYPYSWFPNFFSSAYLAMCRIQCEAKNLILKSLL